MTPELLMYWLVQGSYTKEQTKLKKEYVQATRQLFKTQIKAGPTSLTSTYQQTIYPYTNQ